ncbi:hypothetical protein ACQP2F_41310 [Actinoplanes sp. CA-030573]|uniref:hypothetical protein n=1 Tax=Actinoplanes sp. CA-030573 TaxID=3239898 RepID=UPI003D91151F
MAVADLGEVAERFGLLGLRDTAKFLADYVSLFLPPGAFAAPLAWSVMAVFVPEGADVAEMTAEMRRYAFIYPLELREGEDVLLDVTSGRTGFAGGDPDLAIYDAVTSWNAAARSERKEGLEILPTDWVPVFEDE